MSVTSNLTSSNELGRAFIQLWVEQAASVLSQSSGKTWMGKIVPAFTEGGASILVVFSAGARLRGQLAFRMVSAGALRFVAALLGDDGAVEFTADHREALDELFRQIAGLVATSAGQELGKIELTFAGGEAPAWTAAETAHALFECEGQTAGFALLFSPELLVSLQPPAPVEPPRPTATRSTSEGNLDLLLDVELGVTLRFGERRLLLREILELSSGAVVELDRQVHEPVDLLVDNHLVARGEVVIVGGNYGIRVTEVASAAQRVASIQ